MNYFGKFDAKVSDALGQHPDAHLFSGAVRGSHVPADAVVVPDAHFLFNADFKRAGVDLVLSGDGREVVLHDYFKGEHRAAIASPDGAHLTGDIVNALAGDVQYAQAAGNAAAGQVIGHVTKLVGTATVVRNGVSIIINNGDNVEKGDVVQSGSNSTLGITFIDGTVFGLSSNARMVLNEMVYDPNGSNNSSLLSLVAGTITFVAGETAKHGDMKIDTPVATMGIRGTAVLVEIDFTVPGQTPDAKFQVLVEPDGTTGSYILFDKTTLTPLAVLDKAGIQVNVSNGIASQTLAPLSPEIQKLITDVFSLKFSDTSNTKSLDHFTDSIVPNAFVPVNFAFNGPAPTVPIIVNTLVVNSGSAPSSTTSKFHIPEPPKFTSGADSVNLIELQNKTGSNSADVASGFIQYNDVNVTDHDSLSVQFTGYTYLSANQHQISSLNALQLADIAKVEASIGVAYPFSLDGNGSGTASWVYSVPDKDFDFLAAGEKLTLTYTVTLDNNYQPLDQASTQTITITITGSNDAPVITSPQQNINFVPAGTDTHGGDLIPDTATKGTLAFTDPDLTDTHTVAVKMASALLNGQPLSATVGQTVINELAAAVTACIPTGDDSTGSGAGTIDWKLANLQVTLADLVNPGQTLVLTYVVTVTDSQGATSTQDIVVTIGGNEPAAVVWTDTVPIPPGGLALWTDAGNWEGDRAPLSTDDVFIGTDQVLPATPVFPATITDAEAAKSLTMDYFTDFGTSIPELDIQSTGSLTIGGDLKMGTTTDAGSPSTAETIIKNYGSLTVGGIAELLKNSVLDNYGNVVLDQGGEFGGQSSITNSGTIEVVADILKVEVDIANSGGTIQVDTGATLELTNGAAITGGKLNVASGGTVDVEATSSNTDAMMGGLATVKVSAVLDGVTVNATDPTSTIEVGTTGQGAAILLMDDGTTIINGTLMVAGGSTVDVEAGATGPGATLDDVTVSGVSGDTPSTIEVGLSGPATLTLDHGTTITNGNLTIAGGSIVDVEAGSSNVEALAGGVATIKVSATLDGVTVSGVSGETPSTIEVGATSSAPALLLLDDGTTVTNGNLTIAGGSIVDVEAGSVEPGATLDGVTVSGVGGDTPSTIEVGTTTSVPTTLLIDHDTTIRSGNLTIAGGSTVDVETGTNSPGATLDGVIVNGASGDTPSTIAVGFSGSATLTLDDGTTIINGDLTIAGGSTVDVEAGANGPGATFDGVTVSGLSGDTPSTIEVGLSDPATLTLDDGTTITDGKLKIAGGGTVDVEAGTNGPGATLDGVAVSGVSGGTPSTIDVGLSGPAKLTLDDGTTITDGKLKIAGGSTVDVEAGANGPGATLDGVTVTGVSGDNLSTIEVGLGGAATLKLDDGTTVTNGNLAIAGGSTVDVEAGKSGPGATLDGVVVTGVSGDTPSTIKVGLSAPATLTLDDGTAIIDGDVTIAGGSKMDVESSKGATLDGVSVTNHGTIQVDGVSVGPSPTAVTLVLDGGTEIKHGTLLIHDPNSSDEGIVEIEKGGATFDELTVFNNNQLIIDESVTLTLTDTSIFGGIITDKGTIDVTGDSLISGTFTVHPGGPPTVVDADLNGGKVTVESGVTLRLDNVTLDGTALTGLDSTSVIQVDSHTAIGFDDASIDGGTLDLIGVLNSTGTSSIENAAIINKGNINVVSGTLTIDPTPITNTGTIEAHVNTGLVLSDDVITNSVTTGNTTANGIIQVDQNATLTLQGATINGGILNDFGGLIDVTGNSSINGTASFVNTGIVTADGAALTLSNTTVNNSGGTFKTAGNGIINLVNTTISLGTLAGRITTSSGNTLSTLSGVPNNSFPFGGLSLALGTIVTAAVGVLELTGNIFNFGEIDATTGAVDLDHAFVYGGTLGGSGTVTTSSDNHLSVLNGITVADGTKVTASAGTLALTGTIANHGEIDATTGQIHLDDATVIGGTLGGPGTIATDDYFGPLSVLDDVTIANGTTVGVTDGTVLDLVGTIVDSGTIALNSSGDTTKLEISGHVTLTGGGNVTMGDSSHNFIVSDGSAATLSNDDTISGAGTIGDSHLTLVNNGIIDATGSNPLVIDTGFNFPTWNGPVGSITVTNDAGGILEASAGHTLQIDDNVLNNGFIESGTPGSHAHAYVDITGNVTGTGSIEIFNNSTLEIGGSVSSGQTVTFGAPGGSVSTDGVLVLDDSHDFHGTIVGLTENANESLENEVDLRDLLYIPGLTHAHYHNGEVTISDFFDSVTLNVSGNTSGSFEVTSDGHGGTLLSDPAASGTVTVDSNQTLDIAAASSAAVVFTNSTGNTGELVLDDSKDFIGTVAGFTGDGTTANSDLIDATDINFADVSANKTTYTENAAGTGGTLTLYDANGHALDSINFDGNYQLANFTVESDGEGGTLIVDPPVNTGAQTPDTTHTASNQNSTGTAATDGFVFRFDGHNNPPAIDFHPGQDTLPPAGPALTSTQPPLNSDPESGHWMADGDGHDHVGLSAFAKAHLHSADFHFV